MINTLQIYLVVEMILVVLGIGVIIFFFLRQRRDDIKDSREDDDGTENIEYEEIDKIFPIDDVFDNMIVCNGMKKFISVINCKGVDFYKLDAIDQLRIQNNYIDFLELEREPFCYRQSTRNADVTNTLKIYNSSLQKKEDTLYELAEEYKELEKTIKEQSSNTEEELQNILNGKKITLQKKIKALEWQCTHLESQIQRIKDMSGDSGAQEPVKSYIFSWLPNRMMEESGLSEEEIQKRAAEELKKKIRGKIRQLSIAGVNAWQCTNSELIDMCRIHMMPFTGNKYPVNVLNEMTSDEYIYSTSTVNELKEYVLHDMANDVLVNDMRDDNL